MNENILNKINSFFKRQKRVTAVYLYGSYAKNTAHPKSDLDLAVLFQKPLKNPEKILKMGVQVQKLLGNVLGVDLREIHERLSPTFLREVIGQGKVIFCANEAKRIDFEVKAIRTIDDIQEIEKINLYYLKKSLKEGVYGRAA